MRATCRPRAPNGMRFFSRRWAAPTPPDGNSTAWAADCRHCQRSACSHPRRDRMQTSITPSPRYRSGRPQSITAATAATCLRLLGPSRWKKAWCAPRTARRWCVFSTPTRKKLFTPHSTYAMAARWSAGGLRFPEWRAVARPYAWTSSSRAAPPPERCCPRATRVTRWTFRVWARSKCR